MAEVGARKQAPNIFQRFLEFDAATIYEAAGQQGNVDPAIRPAWPGAKLCGRAVTVECPPGDNLMLHIAVAEAQPGDVIVACTENHLLRGAWGEILTIAAQARNVTGLIIDGAVRDICAIERLRFPIFCRGLSIGACTKECAGRLNIPIELGGVTICPGDLVFGDVDGVVVVPKDQIETVYRSAVQRREREAAIIAQIKEGRTTLELLGLRDVRVNRQRRCK
ncbi:MAG TPA: 4-carboxy-4-hydroxy-2-oxoadipate aldolase/oxaloacetate decarboxylase [Acidobacteriota bacterium]|nr:4-carboxy-4-hydroxy-2-oxoadipate aldolase/oxaloacetate decarboxylase [Acidobacteriota bacterium]